ncbi:MAG TPA: MoaD/ThiS family protein [Anaerolineaceae bacterium]
MPEITVKLFGTLRRLSLKDTPGFWKGEIPAGTRIDGLIKLLGTREEEVAAAAINGVVVGIETEIPDGAVVTLVTPVGGGARPGAAC